MTKPNIIYILADDMGYGDMTCSNPDSKIPTPNLDMLAEEGMRFTDAHAASSVCTPSRYSILTGEHCWRTPLKQSVLWEWDPALITPEKKTVAGFLRDNGYRTACIGKWHLGWNWPTKDGSPAQGDVPIGKFDMQKRRELAENIDFTKPIPGGPVDCGFEYHFGIDVPNFPPYTWYEQDRLTISPTEEKPQEMFGHSGAMAPGWKLEAVVPEITQRAVKYISESEGTPFFLYFALTSPHTPIAPNKEFIGKSGAGLYGDFVCEVDWAVGEVIKALDEKGITENTLLIFTSDNGPEGHTSQDPGAYERIREHNHYSMAELRGIKRDTWEGGHRVPFIARWPEVTPAGTVCSRMTSLMDLFPTCADIIDTELPETAAPDAMTMLPLLKGEDIEVRAFTIHHSCHGKFAVRKDSWVYIDAPTGDDNNEPDWFKAERGYTKHDLPGELYNLDQDISEKQNLYAEYPEIVRELKEILEKTKAGSETTPSDSSDGDVFSE